MSENKTNGVRTKLSDAINKVVVMSEAEIEEMVDAILDLQAVQQQERADGQSSSATAPAGDALAAWDTLHNDRETLNGPGVSNGFGSQGPRYRVLRQ